MGNKSSTNSAKPDGGGGGGHEIAHETSPSLSPTALANNKKGTDSATTSTTSNVDSKSVGGGSSSSAKPLHSDVGTAAELREKYKVEQKEIGHGHYGVVRRCQNRETRDICAIKTIRKAKVHRLEVLRREIEILRKMRHPNVIRLIDVYEDERYLHLVTELLTGGELFDRIIAKTKTPEGHFSERDASRVVYMILKGLSYCHNVHGISHRDLKPENFLFDGPSEDATLKIIDFGLSRYDDDESHMTTKVGTPYYIAPEVLSKRYDKECDLWSIGVVTYVLLCGYPPFYGSTDAEIFAAVYKGKYAFNSPEWDEISDSAKDFIVRLLVKDPACRLTAEQALSHPWVAQNYTTMGVLTSNSNGTGYSDSSSSASSSSSSSSGAGVRFTVSDLKFTAPSHPHTSTTTTTITTSTYNANSTNTTTSTNATSTTPFTTTTATTTSSDNSSTGGIGKGGVASTYEGTLLDRIDEGTSEDSGSRTASESRATPPPSPTPPILGDVFTFTNTNTTNATSTSAHTSTHTSTTATAGAASHGGRGGGSTYVASPLTLVESRTPFAAAAAEAESNTTTDAVQDAHATSDHATKPTTTVGTERAQDGAAVKIVAENSNYTIKIDESNGHKEGVDHNGGDKEDVLLHNSSSTFDDAAAAAHAHASESSPPTTYATISGLAPTRTRARSRSTSAEDTLAIARARRSKDIHRSLASFVCMTRCREALEEVLSSRFTAADLKSLHYSVHAVVVDNARASHEESENESSSKQSSHSTSGSGTSGSNGSDKLIASPGSPQSTNGGVTATGTSSGNSDATSGSNNDIATSTSTTSNSISNSNMRVAGIIREWLAARVDREALDLISQLIDKVLSPSIPTDGQHGSGSSAPSCSLVDVVDRVVVEREARTERTISRAFHTLDVNKQGVVPNMAVAHLLRAENPEAVQAEDVLLFLDLDPNGSMRLPDFRRIVHSLDGGVLPRECLAVLGLSGSSSGNISVNNPAVAPVATSSAGATMHEHTELEGGGHNKTSPPPPPPPSSSTSTTSAAQSSSTSSSTKHHTSSASGKETLHAHSMPSSTNNQDHSTSSTSNTDHSHPPNGNSSDKARRGSGTSIDESTGSADSGARSVSTIVSTDGRTYRRSRFHRPAFLKRFVHKAKDLAPPSDLTSSSTSDGERTI